MAKDSKNRWDEETKRLAVAHWVLEGSLAAASKATGMPISTIQRLKSNTEWFETVSQEAWAEVGEKMKGQYRKINDLAASKLIERLEKGDVRLTKDGDKINVPVSARDLANIAGIAHDKLYQITQRSQTQTGKVVTHVSVLEQIKEDIRRRIAESQKDPNTNVSVLPAQASGET